MTSFATDIQPLFRERDVSAMSWMFDLHKYDDVKQHADAILESIEEGRMPCDSQWDDASVELFRSWIAEDHPA